MLQTTWDPFVSSFLSQVLPILSVTGQMLATDIYVKISSKTQGCNCCSYIIFINIRRNLAPEQYNFIHVHVQKFKFSHFVNWKLHVRTNVLGQGPVLTFWRLCWPVLESTLKRVRLEILQSCALGKLNTKRSNFFNCNVHHVQCHLKYARKM